MLGLFLHWVECSRCEKWEHCICAKASPSVATVETFIFVCTHAILNSNPIILLVYRPVPKS